MQATQVTFQASPQIVEAVLTLLNGFSKTDVQIIAKKDVLIEAQNDGVKERTDISQMGGILAKYVDKPLSNDDIDEAILQGITQRAYPKC